MTREELDKLSHMKIALITDVEPRQANAKICVDDHLTDWMNVADARVLFETLNKLQKELVEQSRQNKKLRELIKHLQYQADCIGTALV